MEVCKKNITVVNFIVHVISCEQFMVNPPTKNPKHQSIHQTYSFSLFMFLSFFSFLLIFKLNIPNIPPHFFCRTLQPCLLNLLEVKYSTSHSFTLNYPRFWTLLSCKDMLSLSSSSKDGKKEVSLPAEWPGYSNPSKPAAHLTGENTPAVRS